MSIIEIHRDLTDERSEYETEIKDSVQCIYPHESIRPVRQRSRCTNLEDTTMLVFGLLITLEQVGCVLFNR